MRENSPKKNFIYNIIYQILTLIIPLIITPYLSRVIGSGGVGIYSYTYSIVHYFMLLTMMGVNNYGNRTIAKVREDNDKLSKTFWSIYLLQLIMGLTLTIIYISYVLIFDNEFKIIALIQSLFIISSMLDINWFFFGLEEFKKTITRNTFVKITNIVLIFLLVKTKSDVWKYTFIMAGMTCLSQLILWGFAKGKVELVKIKWQDIAKHIKPNLVLFIPVIAVSLYKIMDKTMLGSMTNVSEVGLYESAEKIINIPLALITALGTVMLPRMSNIIAKGNIDAAEKYISKSINFVMFLSYAMCAGLIAIGYEFAPFFFGIEFQKTGILIMMLSLTLPFLSFANVLRTQYLIPRAEDKIYIISVFLGAITNLIMNLIFIPLYESIGACIGTIAAEFAVMFYQALAIREKLPIKDYVLKSLPYLLKSSLMLVVIYPFNFLNISSFLRLIIQIGLGCIVYGLLNIKYILSIVKIKEIFKKI